MFVNVQLALGGRKRPLVGRYNVRAAFILIPSVWLTMKEGYAMKKPFFTIGALVGAAGLVLLILASMGGGTFSTGLLILVVGLLMLLVGFFRGESRNE